MVKVIRKRLGELLIERRLITREQLEEALRLQKDNGKPLGQNLVELGYISEEDVVNCLSIQYGFPYLPLGNYEIDREVIKIVPERVARQYCLLPIDRIGNLLTVTIADPLNIIAVSDVESFTECKVQVFISTTSEIIAAIEQYYGEVPQVKES